MDRDYRREYDKLGGERVQERPPGREAFPPLQQAARRRQRRTDQASEQELSEYDLFWMFRKDLRWLQVPGVKQRNRRTGKYEFVSNINKILMMLAPASTFNPTLAWEIAKRKELEDAAAAEAAAAELKASAGGKGGKGGKEKVTKTAEQIREKNDRERAHEKLVAEVTRIRNTKNQLKSLLREISTPDARRILIVEILNRAMQDNNKEGIYEALWAIDECGLSELKAPQPLNQRDLIVSAKQAELVYDKHKDALDLVEKAKKVMQKENDMIRVQLVEMADSLPPLSKFTYGFSLDPWQKRVLKWIDAGRSVLICAPTSSGKTVLSSYVAFIAKTFINKDKIEQRVATTGAVGGGAAGGGPSADKTASAAAKAGDSDSDYGSGDEDVAGDGEDGDDDGDEEGEEEYEQQGSFGPQQTITPQACKKDRFDRAILRKKAMSAVDAKARVLFVVPTEPLVWQVGAYFSKLLREEGDRDTKVAIVSDMLVYHPVRKLGVMPQIVVGTPFALESALTKSRGLCGLEVYGKTSQINLPGGFDHFDWVIYDEVHSLDGPEGEALQRLIRAMNCKFLALSATVGNADQLRGWMEVVKEQQLEGVETIDIITDESILPPAVVATSARERIQAAATPLSPKINIKVGLSVGGLSFVISCLTESSTVANLKNAISERCTAIPADQQQLVFDGQDLKDDKATLASFGMQAVASPPAESVFTFSVRVNTHVNLLYHQGRFINLQRYVWKNGVLADLNPLGAVPSVDALLGDQEHGGVLDNSSLSFTSKDSYKLWKKLEELFPEEAIKSISPYQFFGKDERITLQRTKDYEDLVKKELRNLASKYPRETQELLFAFRLEDPPKEFDICELVLALKEKDMLPCLPFHLNPFEAIRLFQGLVAGLEWRQKRAHPTYYLDLQREKDLKKRQVAAATKATGRNDKAKEEEEKSGEIPMDEDLTVNEWAPHPSFTFCKTLLSEAEFLSISEDMEKFDGFEKRDSQAMKDRPGQSEKVLGHALMRGLRRGVGLFLDEVAFPYYRRAVMNLASQGKLGVIISDDSLAFGVNMPFRTCVFCGEMYDKDLQVPRLTPLMAQQMSGRAGRRGLDTQGNLVYAGSRSSFIRRLMIGEVANTTGEFNDPRYPTMFLQYMISTRHVGIGRVETLGRRTLLEHTLGQDEIEDFSLSSSRQLLVDLHFITEKDGQMVPDEDYEMNYPLLSMVWELRKMPAESITLGRLLPEIFAEFGPLTAQISETKRDKVEGVVFHFFACLLVLIGRSVPVEGSQVLHQNAFFLQGTRKASFDKWQKLFASVQADCPEHLRDAVPPLQPDGTPTPLDGTLFQCLLDRNFVHTLSDDGKQNIKEKLWHLGEVLQVAHNTLWVSNDYYAALIIVVRNAFKKIQYVNTELLSAVIDFDNVASAARETRTDADARTVIPKPDKALPWGDCTRNEEVEVRPNSWSVAIVAASDRLKAAAAPTPAEVLKIQRIFTALQPVDADLIRILVTFKDEDLAAAIASCSAAKAGAQHKIAALTWFCAQVRPACLRRFPLYLKAMFDADSLDEAAILQWHKEPAAASLTSLPEGAVVGEETVLAAKTACVQFVEWLQNAEDDDDDDDDDDDEDEDD